MPSSAKSILTDYEELFKYPKDSFISKLFKKYKNTLPAICPFCKIEVSDQKTKRAHREICWKLHVIYTAKCDILSRLSQAKLIDNSKDDSSIESYCNLLSKLDKTMESEAPKWELKYFKPLKYSLIINLNNFEFIKPITKGGYGQIFLIKDKYNEKLMCAKIISISEAIQRSCLRSYVQERNFLLMCNSDQIVSLFYTFHTEFFIYQIMEYMESGDISAHLEVSGRFPESLVKNILVHVLLGLRELESKRIVHGDIKLENILYSKEKDALKLADFGLAFEAQNSAATSSSLGTPEYMAPEQILHGRKGYESDMWAVGICTYEMLFGIPPYYDETPEKIFQKITGSFEIDWMGEPASDIVKDLIMKLLDHNFQSRLSLKEAMHHPFFSEIDWSNPPKVNLPERVGIFDERNKRYNSFQYYNKATLSTEVVAFGDGVYNQNTSVDNQIELLKLFPIKNLNKLK